jgi:transposase
MKQTSDDKRRLIMNDTIAGLSSRIIAERHGISKTTVIRTQKAHDLHPHTALSGRPALLGARDRRYLVRQITSGQADTVVTSGQFLFDTLGKHCSAQTIRRALKKEGLKAVVKKKKPFLKASHKKARLDFASKYKDWTNEDWARVIFSDETKINRFGSDGRKWVWKKPAQKLSSIQVKPTLKFGGGSIMFWGCMSIHGTGFGCRIDGGLDADLYTQILGGELLWSIEKFGLNGDDIIFQHDNDPKHSSKMAKEWIKSHNMEVLDWPSQSPDLNPIEHIWVILKQRLSAYEESPNSMHDLWSRVEQEWYKIPVETCKNLIEGMPRRIAAVLSARGGYTKY